MSSQDQDLKKDSKNIEFELSKEDLKAIAAGKAVQVPSAKFFGKTTFTIENAPIPKSIDDSVTIQIVLPKTDKK